MKVPGIHKDILSIQPGDFIEFRDWTVFGGEGFALSGLKDETLIGKYGDTCIFVSFTENHNMRVLYRGGLWCGDARYFKPLNAKEDWK